MNSFKLKVNGVGAHRGPRNFIRRPTQLVGLELPDSLRALPLPLLPLLLPLPLLPPLSPLPAATQRWAHLLSL